MLLNLHHFLYKKTFLSAPSPYIPSLLSCTSTSPQYFSWEPAATFSAAEKCVETVALAFSGTMQRLAAALFKPHLFLCLFSALPLIF